MATADECRGRLERAGWSVRKAGPHAWGLLGWTVSAEHPAGERVWFWGNTREAAWREACRRAEELGRLPAG